MRFKRLSSIINIYTQKSNLSTFENRNVLKLLEERGLLTCIFPNKK